MVCLQFFKGGLRAPLFLFFSLKAHFVIEICLVLVLVLGGDVGLVLGESPLSGENPAHIGMRGNQLFISGEVFSANTALPLRDLLRDDWEAPLNLSDDNRAMALWHLAVGNDWQGWRLAGIYRGELFLSTSRDTLDLLYRIKRHEDLPVGKTYVIDLQAKGFTAQGVQIGRGFDASHLFAGLRGGVAINYLRGRQLQKGDLSGNASALTNKSYNFDLQLDYYYDHNYLYDRAPLDDGWGDGYGIDAGFLVERATGWGGGAAVRDLCGTMIWHHIPYTNAIADSQSWSSDEQGYQLFRPTIHGFEGYHHFRQRISPKVDGELWYRAEHHSVGGTVNVIDGERYLWLNAGWHPSLQREVTLAYLPASQLLSVTLRHKLFTMRLGADHPNPQQARALAVMALWSHPW